MGPKSHGPKDRGQKSTKRTAGSVGSSEPCRDCGHAGHEARNSACEIEKLRVQHKKEMDELNAQVERILAEGKKLEVHFHGAIQRLRRANKDG
ncbi:hypothetical protein N7456_012408 [Penicillium angulare]|uniref:Uncharacterized protein n=1 Tax=Penicillium angulare TaxID=116970 RepID=A0A9W9EVL7_9EURO|nr:hypothetical protein N7456_012408 [Penicillium angulare]